MSRMAAPEGGAENRSRATATRQQPACRLPLAAYPSTAQARVIQPDLPAEQQQLRFDIAVTRFLDAEGQLCAPLPAFARAPGALRTLYAAMVEARIFDKKATALQRAGQLGGYLPRLGFEAIGTAIGGVLREDDLLLPAWREPAAQLLRGTDMHELFAYWSDPPSDSASPLLQALALARRGARGDASIALLSCDDRVDGEASVEEHLLAAMHANLPIVVVVASVARTPAGAEQRLRAPLTRRALASGVHAEAVDGNDVVALRHVLDGAVARARRGGGPTFIEALTWRLFESSEARSEEERQAAWEHCPIRRLRRYISSQDLWSVQDEEALLMNAGEHAESAARRFLGASSGAR